MQGINPFFRSLLSLALAPCATAALSVTVIGTTHTQAVMQETGFSGSCTIALSASPTYSPLHPDVNGTEYSGASSDTGRADTVVSTDGTKRTVTLGHQIGDRALAAYTVYYYQISGCGGDVTGAFKTDNIPMGTTRSEAAPFDPLNWGNLGWPKLDWTTVKTYTDPLTGVKVRPIALTTMTWRTGCGNGYGCASGYTGFTDYAGGSGWSAAPSIISTGSGKGLASTGNTNTIDVYADLASVFSYPQPYDFHRVLHDIGLVVWGYATSQRGQDNQVKACIILNPGSGCVGRPITITLPKSNSAAPSGSGDKDQAWPPAFPRSPFYGWSGSTSPIVRMENLETFGTATVSGSTLTIASPTSTQHFSSALAAGNKIYVSGSSPACVNYLCTVATNNNARSITLVETPSTPGTQSFRAYGWGIRLWKYNAGGTATISVAYKLAGSNAPIGAASLGQRCSTVGFTSGDGKRGYLCELTTSVAAGNYLGFVADDGTARVLAQLPNLNEDAGFDNINAKVFYQAQTNTNCGKGGCNLTIYKYTYGGNASSSIDYGYQCSSAGQCPDESTVPTQITGRDLMGSSDLNVQVLNKWSSTYDSMLYGPWTANIPRDGWVGVTGHYAVFQNAYAGQGGNGSGGPGWIAVVDLLTGKVVNLIHTLDATGAPGSGLRFGSMHSVQLPPATQNVTNISLDDLTTNSRSTLNGGPFQAPVVSVLAKDGVTWSSNTALPWPPDGSYYGTCPAGTQTYIDCVTFRLPRGGVCNTAATPTMVSRYPCPWNAGYSQFPLMQAGDNSVDLARPDGPDSEHFKVLAVSADAGNTVRIVAARNATYDYCSYSPWHGIKNPYSVIGAGNIADMRHLNGWVLTMMPGSYNSCYQTGILINNSTGVTQEFGRSLGGHYAISVGPHGYSFINYDASLYNAPYANMQTFPYGSNRVTANAQFNGYSSSISAQQQSYPNADQVNAGESGYLWSLDFNSLAAEGTEALSPLEHASAPYSISAVPGTTNIYQISTDGSAYPLTNAIYKTQPMIGWAGRYTLTDVSGPSSATTLAATPFGMCYAYNAGECVRTSAAGYVYVNVPQMYNAGACVVSQDWANSPCIIFGDNSPVGSVRQFGIWTNDGNVNAQHVTDGSYSRAITYMFGSPGRHYPFPSAQAGMDGGIAFAAGSFLVDGFSMTGFSFNLPPYDTQMNPDNQIRHLTVQVSPGPAYAAVEFGYSRYIGPNASPTGGLYCTARQETCVTSNSVAPFAFAGETQGQNGCTASCMVSVPVVGGNVVYYRIKQSIDGAHWTYTTDLQAVAVP